MKILLASIITLLSSCTHYRAISFEELVSKNIIGKWEMSLPPYYINIQCDGTLSFVKPSKYLYADQNGKNFVITQLKEDAIITGPVIRYDFKVEEWPHDVDGRILMTIDGRVWNKTQNYKCE